MLQYILVLRHELPDVMHASLAERIALGRQDRIGRYGITVVYGVIFRALQYILSYRWPNSLSASSAASSLWFCIALYACQALLGGHIRASCV